MIKIISKPTNNMYNDVEIEMMIDYDDVTVENLEELFTRFVHAAGFSANFVVTINDGECPECADFNQFKDGLMKDLTE